MLADKEDLCLAGWPGWWGPDYRGRKDAIKQTVDADMLDSDQSDDSLALFGSWQLTSGNDVIRHQPCHVCPSTPSYC